MRFHSTEHLETWRRTKRFPEIHNDIFQFIVEEAEGKVFLDLGACFGLLATRLQGSAFGWKAVAVEANPAHIEHAKAAGIPVEFLTMAVNRDTLPQLAEFVKRHAVTSIVARRVLPEIWGEDLAGGAMFATSMREAGVKEFILQGRVKTPNAVNALSTVESEIALLCPAYKLASARRDIARLV